MSLPIRDALLLQDLDRRVKAIEAQLRGESEHSGNEPLKEEIGRLLEADTGSHRGTAKRVAQALADTDIGRREKPSLRTVQHYITQLRALRR